MAERAGAIARRVAQCWYEANVRLAAGASRPVSGSGIAGEGMPVKAARTCHALTPSADWGRSSTWLGGVSRDRVGGEAALSSPRSGPARMQIEGPPQALSS